ncbi:MAG: hypothetical protein WD651_11720 [Acidimicrobiia bacterium]
MGDEIDYAFTVTNTGNVTLTEVAVSDSLGITVTCDDATLAPDASTDCDATYTITQADIDDGQVANTATATAEGPQGQDASNIASDTVLLPQVATLELEKSAAPTTYNTVGQTISYSFLVTNTGNVTLTNLSVIDSHVTTVSCPSTTIAAGTTVTCTGSYTTTQADVDNGSVTNTATASAQGPQGQPASHTDSATVNVVLVSTSALTHSAAKSTTEISNQLVTNFEILLNGQNIIVATNPGQFFYHQWATNPYSITTSWEFELDWTDKFEAQTSDGNPINAFIQMPGSSTFTNWTSHSTDICWTTANGCPANKGQISVNDVPAGATVWVMAHIDFKPKGSNISTLTPNPMQRPVTYGPLSSSIIIHNQESPAVVGTSFSSTTVIGRGKKVTMLYGTATSPSGAVMVDTWVQVKQGTNTATTKTDSGGSYVFFDGQGCSAYDGIHGSCTGTWTTALNFGTGNVSSTVTFFGQGASPTGSEMFPAGIKAEVRTATQALPLATITTPSYTFTVKKGDAHNRDFKFKN